MLNKKKQSLRRVDFNIRLHRDSGVKILEFEYTVRLQYNINSCTLYTYIISPSSTKGNDSQK
jgi:hypothetical protein